MERLTRSTDTQKWKCQFSVNLYKFNAIPMKKLARFFVDIRKHFNRNNCSKIYIERQSNLNS